MDALTVRIQTAAKALGQLAELCNLTHLSDVERDAALQRFEYTLEAIWKAAKVYLDEREGLRVSSPKAAVRACLLVGLLREEEAELALQMVDDRNASAHTYNEALARTIAERLPMYGELLEKWLAAMREPS